MAGGGPAGRAVARHNFRVSREGGGKFPRERGLTGGEGVCVYIYGESDSE